eukprot:CAMPEP_0182569134 /NCGR_PEP_ID=MMETSP1324-20130603/9853_1 /TAXON_ID=236786 /ORGANISM="Florenciella sp., Strain RCC1587" /LENGTH=64 /DNA_ID=CAMNT_0024783367 /DNA_START=798 /DNA_END=992 /DNA_ORIENTATION=-
MQQRDATSPLPSKMGHLDGAHSSVAQRYIPIGTAHESSRHRSQVPLPRVMTPPRNDDSGWVIEA